MDRHRRFLDLAQGKLPEAHDLAILRAGPRHQLTGLALAARDAWSQLHARDPRSNQLTAAEARGQQTLLTWVRTNRATVEALTRSTGQCGRPEYYKLHFGQKKDWEGWMLRQLLTLAAGNSSGVRERAMKAIGAQVPPGNYLAWLTDQTPSTRKFTFNLPYDFYTYLALKELEDEVRLAPTLALALALTQSRS